MHSFLTLASDLSARLKKSGDSGGTGDKLQKPLRDSSNYVPTLQIKVSPLQNEWGHKRAVSGDENSVTKQRDRFAVPTAPSVPTKFEQAHAPTLAPDNVHEWYAMLEELTAFNPPEWASPVRWQNMIFDADAFLSRWAIAADQLSWTALDLFGVHPNAPADRYDVMGLLHVVQGGAVVALTADAATIRRPSQAILTYRLRNAAGGVLVLDMVRQHAFARNNR
jgi:hypothetical protein